MKKVFITLIVIFALLFLFFIFMVLTNETFFKTTYIGVGNKEIFIPKYSFFEQESGMTCVCFKSLKSESQLKEEINNYMKDFEYFKDETSNGGCPYVYKKGDLVIQSYEVKNEGLYRRIIITYD